MHFETYLTSHHQLCTKEKILKNSNQTKNYLTSFYCKLQYYILLINIKKKKKILKKKNYYNQKLAEFRTLSIQRTQGNDKLVRF